MQPQIDDLRKELKMQQRVFQMLSLTPEQKRVLASEHPEMLPPMDGSPSINPPAWPPTVGSNLNPGMQGYDPVNAMYRGSWGRFPQRGGYQGAAGRGGFVSRGGYRGSQTRGGYRGGANNQRGGGNLPAPQTTNTTVTRPQNNNGNNNNIGNINNGNNNVISSNPGYSVSSNNVNSSPSSGGRGNFNGGRGQQRGSYQGGPYVFSASYNVGCANCWETNAPSCPHCFQCGESGHAAATCPLNC